MPNLKTSVAGVELENPTVLASGILGVTSALMLRVAHSDAGAVTTKSIGIEKRKGHENPVIVEVEGGLLNAVGLSTSADAFEELRGTVEKSPVPVIASIWGKTIEEFGEVASRVSECSPALIEVNISCPNVKHFGKVFGSDAKTAAQVTKAVKAETKIPVIVKLTPNVPDIGEIAKAVEAAGADAISAINTLGPGMVIDLKSKKQVLSNKTGGLSGPAIRPVAVRCVYEIYETVEIPIIGIGGVTSGKDAIEMMMAGACAVGIGTGVMYRGIGIFEDVCEEIKTFMLEEGYQNLKEIIGAGH